MAGSPLEIIADALSRPKKIRGEDGREVEERDISEITDAISLCSDLEADANGSRQRALVLKPKKRRL
jgi:hypothetical protein